MIALTVLALDGDPSALGEVNRDRCLAVGAMAYFTQPSCPKVLLAGMRQHLPMTEQKMSLGLATTTAKPRLKPIKILDAHDLGP